MCKPVFPLKAIFYNNNNSIEDIWILDDFDDISNEIEEHSPEDNKDRSLKIFDATNQEIYLEVDSTHRVKVLKYKKIIKGTV